MQDQPIPPAVEDVQIDQALLGALLTDESPLWSFGELVCQFGNQIAVTDSINRLAGQGLVHRLDQFVFATRAAAKATDLALA
jgi:hypothetical protein